MTKTIATPAVLLLVHENGQDFPTLWHIFWKAGPIVVLSLGFMALHGQERGDWSDVTNILFDMNST